MKTRARTGSQPKPLKCPICGELVRFAKGEPLPEGFPFCSGRCKMVDLNMWFDEHYVLSRELTPEEQMLLSQTESDERDDH